MEYFYIYLQSFVIFKFVKTLVLTYLFLESCGEWGKRLCPVTKVSGLGMTSYA